MTDRGMPPILAGLGGPTGGRNALRSVQNPGKRGGRFRMTASGQPHYESPKVTWGGKPVTCPHCGAKRGLLARMMGKSDVFACGHVVLKAEPKAPGSKGGKYYHTKTGRVRYGVKPAPGQWVRLLGDIPEGANPPRKVARVSYQGRHANGRKVYRVYYTDGGEDLSINLKLVPTDQAKAWYAGVANQKRAEDGEGGHVMYRDEWRTGMISDPASLPERPTPRLHPNPEVNAELHALGFTEVTGDDAAGGAVFHQDRWATAYRNGQRITNEIRTGGYVHDTAPPDLWEHRIVHPGSHGGSYTTGGGGRGSASLLTYLRQQRHNFGQLIRPRGMGKAFHVERGRIVLKAEQLNLFGKPREPVKEPGKRGGKFYRTEEKGEVRYGEKPQAKPAAAEPSVACPACKQTVPQSQLGDHRAPTGFISDRCNGSTKEYDASKRNQKPPAKPGGVPESGGKSPGHFSPDKDSLTDEDYENFEDFEQGQAEKKGKDTLRDAAAKRTRESKIHPKMREHAHKVIGELSAASQKQMNTTQAGDPTKRHRPYAVPEHAQKLIHALGKDDAEEVSRLLLEHNDRKAMGARDPGEPAAQKPKPPAGKPSSRKEGVEEYVNNAVKIKKEQEEWERKKAAGTLEDEFAPSPYELAGLEDPTDEEKEDAREGRDEVKIPPAKKKRGKFGVMKPTGRGTDEMLDDEYDTEDEAHAAAEKHGGQAVHARGPQAGAPLKKPEAAKPAGRVGEPPGVPSFIKDRLKHHHELHKRIKEAGTLGLRYAAEAHENLKNQIDQHHAELDRYRKALPTLGKQQAAWLKQEMDALPEIGATDQHSAKDVKGYFGDKEPKEAAPKAKGADATNGMRYGIKFGKGQPTEFIAGKPKTVRPGKGMVITTAHIKLPDGTILNGIVDLDEESSWEHSGTGIFLPDGRVVFQDDKDFQERVKEAFGVEKVFPYKYKPLGPYKSAKLEDFTDHHVGPDGWST